MSITNVTCQSQDPQVIIAECRLMMGASDWHQREDRKTRNWCYTFPKALTVVHSSEACCIPTSDCAGCIVMCASDVCLFPRWSHQLNHSLSCINSELITSAASDSDATRPPLLPASSRGDPTGSSSCFVPFKALKGCWEISPPLWNMLARLQHT